MSSSKRKGDKKNVAGGCAFLAGILLGSGALVGCFVFLEVSRVENDWLRGLNSVYFRLLEFFLATVVATSVMVIFMLIQSWIKRLSKK